MDPFDTTKKVFENEAYRRCGINVDTLSSDVLKAVLKRLLGIAADSGALRYIAACKEEIEVLTKSDFHKYCASLDEDGYPIDVTEDKVIDGERLIAEQWVRGVRYRFTQDKAGRIKITKTKDLSDFCREGWYGND